MANLPSLTYESAQSELEKIYTELQDPETSMDQMEEKLARAAELIKYCKNRLRNMESSLEDWMAE